MVIKIGGPEMSGEETRLTWRLAGMGFQFGTEIIAGVLLGWLVDRFFGTSPWGVVTGAIIGVLVAVTDFMRKAWRLNRELDRTQPKRMRAAPPPPLPDEDLTHDKWKQQRDRELEPDTHDDQR